MTKVVAMLLVFSMTTAMPVTYLSAAYAMTPRAPIGMPGLIGNRYAIQTFQHLETVIRAINDGTAENRVLDLRANILAPRALTIAQSSNIVILGNDHEIRFNNNTGGSFIVHGDLHIVSTALQGRGQGSATGILVHSSGQLTTQGDTIISRFPASGVRVLGGSFAMQDTIIEDNSATGGGAGVWVDIGGTFTMASGAIRNNRAGLTAWGGAVRLERDTVFNMHGGSISGHTAGGGAGVAHHGVFNMTGGSIYNNTAAVHLGGGVHVGQHGTFIMSGDAKIANNSAHTNGGGVDVSANATFTINGGTITNNTALRQSGGVHTRPNGTFSNAGGVVSGNTAPMFPDIFGVTTPPPLNPTITILTPIPANAIRAPYFDVAFSARPSPQAHITSIHYTVDGGAAINLPAGPSGSTRIDLEPGTNHVEFTVVDSLGGIGRASFEIVALEYIPERAALLFAEFAASTIHLEETFLILQSDLKIDLSRLREILSGLDLSERQLDQLRAFLKGYLRANGQTGWGPPSQPSDEQLAKAGMMENAILRGIASSNRHRVDLAAEAQHMFIALHIDKASPFWNIGIMESFRRIPITMQQQLTNYLTSQDRHVYRNYKIGAGLVDLFTNLGHVAIWVHSAANNVGTIMSAAQVARDNLLSAAVQSSAAVTLLGTDIHAGVEMIGSLEWVSEQIARALRADPYANVAEVVNRYAALVLVDQLPNVRRSVLAVLCSLILGAARRATIPAAIKSYLASFALDFTRNFIHNVAWIGMRGTFNTRYGFRFMNQQGMY